MAKQPPNVVQRHADSDEDIEEDIEEDIVVGSDVEDMEEDIDIVDDGSRQDAATNKFDRLVGALEEVLMDPDFEEERENFCRGHCQHFEASDENKLIYTDVFTQYSQLVEGAIERRLKAAVPGFSMEEFMVMLDQRKDELMSDVFDFLLTLGDFEAFKESMLAYNKEQREGSILEVSCMAMPIHTEEQEDGDERPDLDFGLTVSSLGAGNRGGSKPAATPGAGSRHGGNNGGKRR